MTGCPVGHGQPQSSLTPPSVGTVALDWPDLDEPCGGQDHDGNRCRRAAVVTGTVTTYRLFSFPNATYDDRIAACLDHASFHWDDFAADPHPSGDPRVVPDLDEVTNARDSLRWRRATDAERREIVANKINRTVTEAEYAAGQQCGLPRPMVDVKYDPTYEEETPRVLRLPAPWIGGVHASADADFFSFRPDALRSVDERLCCICGDPCGASVAIAAAGGKRATSAGWGHPRCVVLAVRTCPHFTEPADPANGIAAIGPKFETVAYRWDGPGIGCVRPTLGDMDDIEPDATPLTWDALRAWAKNDPWGRGRDERHR